MSPISPFSISSLVRSCTGFFGKLWPTRVISPFSLAMSAFHSGIAGPALVFAGLGLICLAIGAGALVLMLLAWGLRQFGRYVRLHYRVLDKTTKA